MRVQTTIYLLIAVAVGALFIWFLETDQVARDPGKAVLADLRWEGVEELVVVRGDWRVVCRRSGRDWRIADPFDAPADTTVIERMLIELERLEVDERITAQDLKMRDLSLEDYELSVPRATLTIRAGLRTWELRVGSDKPTRDGVYVQALGAPDILATSSNVLAALPETVADLRDRHVLDGSPERVTRLDMDRADNSFVRLQRTDGTWWLQQPVETHAETAEVTALLMRLFSIRAAAFVWDQPIASGEPDDLTGLLEGYGLRDGDAVLQVALWQGTEAEAQRLAVGKKTPEGDAHYAWVVDTPSIFTVSAAVVATLRDAPADTLRDQRVLHMAPADVTQVSITEGEQKLTLERRDGGAWISEPVQWPADAALVDTLIREVATLEVATFTNAAALDLAKMGLLPPRVGLTFSGRPDAEGRVHTNRLSLGQEQIASAARLATADDGRTAFTIRHAALHRMWPEAVVARLRRRTDPLAYRDRVVLNVDPATVRALTVHAKGYRTTVERTETGTWRTLAPEGGSVASNAVSDLLIELADLRAMRVEVLNPDDLAPFGINETSPSVVIGLSGEEGIQKKLVLGTSAAAGGRYAMIQGHELVFVLSTGSVARLERPVARGLTLPRSGTP